jgi:hypothetical protein
MDKKKKTTLPADDLWWLIFIAIGAVLTMLGFGGW